MAYVRQGPFVDDGPPGVSAARLNAIEDGIFANEAAAAAKLDQAAGDARYQRAVAFGAWRSASRTLTHGAYNNLACDVELFDPTNGYDTATGRWQPQVSGWYRAGGFFMTDKLGWVQGDYAQFVLRKNNSTREAVLDQHEIYETVPGGWYGLKGQGEGRVFLNGTTDFLTVEVYLNRPAGAVNLTVGSKDMSYVWAERVSA